MSRQLFPVACKAALFNPGRSKVIVVEYQKDNFGLPGGHIEAGEDPDTAMRRELREELGIDSDDLQLERIHFSSHPDGKIVLGYWMVIADDTPISIDINEVSQFHWVSVDDIRSEKIDIGVYRELVLK